MTTDTDRPLETTAPVTPAIDLTPPTQTPAAEKVAVEVKPTMRQDIEASLKTLRDRPRDEAGRFAAQQAADAAKAALKTPVAPLVVVKPERPADMPKAWGADKGAQWATLTPEAKAYVLERETQMEGFHSKFGGLAQWHEAAAANNTTLPEVLERVNKVESAMIADPAQGFILAGEMVGMDRNATARALISALQKLGVQLPSHSDQAPNTQQPAQLPPELQSLQQRIDTIEGTFKQQAEADQRQALAKAQDVVKAFFADPANKHANELQTEISGELKAMKAMGKVLDLKVAYERALWTRPDLRDKLIAEQVAPKQAEAEAAKAQALLKARSASRSVAGSPPLAEGRSSAERPSKLRDEIAMRVRNAQGRV